MKPLILFLAFAAALCGQAVTNPGGASSISGLTSGALVAGSSSTTIATPSATATLDSSGNISTPGGVSTGVGGSAAGAIQFTQGTAASLGTTSITLHAPTSVTSYRVVFPSAAATGFRLWTNSANVVTETVVANPLPVANGGTALASGTSGGVLYYSASGTLASSGALTANGVVLGGGAGVTPTVTSADSTTTHALFATAGAPAFRAMAGSDLPTTWGGIQITNTGAGGGIDIGGNGVTSSGTITANGKLTIATYMQGGSSIPSVNAASCTGATIGSNSTNLGGTITGLPASACSVVLTFAGATATHGWLCAVSDQTTANLFRQSANTTTTVTFSGTSAAADVLAYGPCAAY